MSNTVYYDYYDGEKVPVWYVVNFGASNINWEDEVLHVPISAPFESQGLEDFDHDTVSATITLGDITRPIDNSYKIGIYLPRVRDNINNFGGDHSEVGKFIMLVADIEEVLQSSVIRDHFYF